MHSPWLWHDFGINWDSTLSENHLKKMVSKSVQGELYGNRDIDYTDRIIQIV